MTEEILAEGWWCFNCNFFEEERPRAICQACGCSNETHRKVRIIGEGN